MQQNLLVRIIALCTLLASLAGSVGLTPLVAGSVGRHGLAFTDRAEEGDPPEVALGIAMGAFRGVFVNFLWIRANTLKEEGKHYEAIELARAITKLQPRFPRVWVFQAWNLSYNISVTTQTPEERWTWVSAGINLLRDEGLRANPNDMFLHKELAWIFQHKVGGYTDDANIYYKKQVAKEWYEVLGPPPAPDTEDRSTERAKAQFAEWLTRIKDAAPTRSALADRNPAAEELADAIESRVGEPIGPATLRRWTAAYELDLLDGRVDRSLGAYARERASQMGPKTNAMIELYEDPAWASAWDDLLLHVRLRTLVDDYNMDPLLMIRMTERFGPFDWRLPAAHAVYWAYRGVDVGRMEVDTENLDSFDFVNTYRLVAQGLQDQWRYGRLYFNYLDIAENRPNSYYFMVPSEHFVDAYAAIIDQAQAESGIFEDERRPYRIYSAGYENFLQDVIEFFYRRGQTARAEAYYEKLRTYEGQNLNDPGRTARYSLPLDKFVQTVLFDRYDSPNVAVGQVATSLELAFRDALLSGDLELYRSMTTYAQQVHTYFVNKQFRDVVAAGGDARFEFMDRDFAIVRAQMFVQIMRELPLREAERLYYYADDDLKRWSYDFMQLRFAERLDQNEEGRQFADIFPEPSGMEAFRERREQLRLDREAERERVDGIRQK